MSGVLRRGGRSVLAAVDWARASRCRLPVWASCAAVMVMLSDWMLMEVGTNAVSVAPTSLWLRGLLELLNATKGYEEIEH